MLLKSTAITSVLCFLTALQPVTAMLPLTLKGNRFIRPSTNPDDAGTVFFVNGVDYQPGGSSDYSDDMTSDVLTDPEVCARDATLIQNLGANTIRIYTIDPELNHDECMSIFNEAGIYVILDVNSPLGGQSINRYDPESTYNAWYMSRVFKVIESFRTYSNVLGFFIGNEVINDSKSAKIDPAYLRAVTRDAREYIETRMVNDTDARDIFIGYSAADDVKLRLPTFEYLTCALDGDDNEDISSVEFFGLNTYEWCSGVNNWQNSGYADIGSTFKNSSVPVFFSEYGCNTKSPRTFDEISGGIYDGLIDVLDGGLVYEYSNEESNYGLVDIEDKDSIVLLQDYFNFKDQLKKSDIPTISEDDVEDYTPPKCNATLIESHDSAFNANFTLPAANKDTRWMIENGVDISHTGSFVNVDKYVTMYVSGGTVGTNLTKAEFSYTSNSKTLTTDIYLTVDKSNLVNSLSTSGSSKSSSAEPSTTSSSSSSSSSSSVSSISSTHKNDAGNLQAANWAAGAFGVVMALI